MTLKLFLYLLVMVNPFSQVLYVWELMKQMTFNEFASTYWRAGLLSFGVFVFFALTGEFLFEEIFQVRLDAMRIFGGLVILLISFRYFTDGSGSNLLFRGKAEDLSPHISLPFQVGPGTIWVSILIGQSQTVPFALLTLASVVFLNFCLVVIVHYFVQDLERYRETMISKYFGILMRTNALFVGAIAVEMILTGIQGTLESRAILP